MLFSVETQTTEERTEQYQSEVESIYKDLTAKGKALMLSTELGVRSLSQVSRYLESFSLLVSPWIHLDQRPAPKRRQTIRKSRSFLTARLRCLYVPSGRRRRVQPDPLPGLLLLQPHAPLQRLQVIHQHKERHKERHTERRGGKFWDRIRSDA